MARIPLKIKDYGIIFKHSPAIMVMSSDLEVGKLIEVNEAFEKAFKCKKEQILGLSTVDMGFWADPQVRVRVLKSLREKGQVLDCEILFRDTTGQVFPGLYTGAIVEIGGNECLLSTIINVTECRRADVERTRLAQLVESASDAIIGKTPDGTVTSWNRGAERIYGYTANDIVGRPITLLSPPDRHAEISRILERLRRKERISHIETVHRTRDGRDFPVSLCLSPINDPSGELIGISTIARNITPVRLNSEALWECEERFRQMADTVPALIWVAGPEAGCIFFNKTWLAFTGRSMAQELGYGWLENVHPDDREHCVGIYRAAFEARRDFRMEYRLRRANGEYAWVADTGTPRFVDGGSFIGYIGSGFDITERKLAEQELKENEETLKTLMDLMPVGVRWSDSNGNMEYVNKSFVELFGYHLEEIPTLDEWFAKAYPDPAYREEIRGRWEAAIDRANVNFTPIDPLESDVTCKDGSLRHVIVSTQFAGNRRLVIFTDVTVRDTVLDRMLNAQRLESLGVLAGRIAHDFNNVLTGIMGNISLARMFIDNREKLEQLLVHGEQASRRAAELVSQLLTFAKGGAPIRKPISVRRLVKEAVASALHGNQVKAIVDLPESLHDIEADTGQLSQVFNHIIVNAVHAMAGGGTLTVHARNVFLAEINEFALPGGEYLTLDFTDEGCGIPDRDLKRVFDPYFTTKPSGTGIGLASSHSIVKKHGGHIDVHSTVGKGSTFTVYLPSIGFSIDEQAGGKEGSAAGAHGGALLVMDDEWIVRDIAKEMLEHLGYQVTVCSNGEEAVELYKAAKDTGRPFAAAIMDITVPCSMGGEEAAREILEIDPSACLIVSSGYSNDPIIADYSRYGFSAALTKPYIYDELERVLSSIDKATAEPKRRPSPDH